MYVATIPNRDSPPAILLRESYREGGKVKNRTLANLSHWDPAQIELFKKVLKKERVSLADPLDRSFQIVSSRQHGNVAAVWGALRRSGLDRALCSKSCRHRDLVEAMIIAQVLKPRSKLALARMLDEQCKDSTLGELLAVTSADEDELYDAMDWLLERQPHIEEALAQRHLAQGGLVLYDVSSTYFEGKKCPLAKLGYSRDEKKHLPQIVFGLLTDQDGCPVAVEVFEGNTGDPKTLGTQITKVRERFGIKRVVLVGDRGMITDARIRDELRPLDGVDWITALRNPAIEQLVERKSLQLGLFDDRDLAEITDPQYPDERLMVCRNPLLAAERARKRQELLEATEKALEKVAAATRREKKPLRGKAPIGVRVGRVLGRFKMAKHFDLEIEDDGFHYRRREVAIAEEAALDGIYVVRTNVGVERLGASEAVRCYKRLAAVERAFRTMKTVELHVRPIRHRKENRVRAHIFLCMLAYYVVWHMRKALAPILFDDDAKPSGEGRSPVAPAKRSPKAERKARTKRTAEGEMVYSFRSLLDHLSQITKNTIKPHMDGLDPFEMVTRPTPLQERAFQLLGVSLAV
jgi:transposase